MGSMMAHAQGNGTLKCFQPGVYGAYEEWSSGRALQGWTVLLPSAPQPEARPKISVAEDPV